MKYKLDCDGWTLGEWSVTIKLLIEAYGIDAKITFDTDYDDVSVFVEFEECVVGQWDRTRRLFSCQTHGPGRFTMDMLTTPMRRKCKTLEQIEEDGK